MTDANDHVTSSEMQRMEDRVTGSMRELREDVKDIRESSRLIDKSVAVLGDRVDRMEKVVYGAVGVALTGLVTSVVAAVINK